MNTQINICFAICVYAIGSYHYIPWLTLTTKKKPTKNPVGDPEEYLICYSGQQSSLFIYRRLSTPARSKVTSGRVSQLQRLYSTLGGWVTDMVIRYPTQPHYPDAEQTSPYTSFDVSQLPL